MDFQLKTLSLPQAASEKADALIVLASDAAISANDALSQLVSVARKAGDLPDKVGKWITLYRPAQVAAKRVVLVSIGDGKPASVRSAVLAAFAAVGGVEPKRLAVVFAQAAAAGAVRAAVIATADASYVYTATKPKADARTVKHVVVGVADATAARTAFDEASAMVAGIEFAKEWGNRPANHATPSMLADAARTLADGSRIQCEVLGPKEVAKLGMGSFAAVAQGSAEPCASSCCATTAPPRETRPSCWSARASHSTPAACPSNLPPKWTR